MLLEQWLNVEKDFGDFGDVTLVQAKLPRRLKRKRPIVNEDGGSAGFEETSMIFFQKKLITRTGSFSKLPTIGRGEKILLRRMGTIKKHSKLYVSDIKCSKKHFSKSASLISKSAS